ncbi:MAG TPA: cache domain-containing protein [Syntrophorhabdaceae bacterium]|jgi:hypothetical protein
MKRIVSVMILVLMVSVGVAFIANAATMDDAKVLVDKALVYMKAHGLERTIAEVNGNPKGQLTKGDLYVIIQDFNGVILANGGNPKLTGQNHLEVRDASGKYFVKEQVEVAKTKGSGTVDLVWTNPATKMVQPKTNFVKRVEGQNIMVMAGVFK